MMRWASSSSTPLQVGDSVAADDTVAVVDTHKASVDIRTPSPGTVSRLLAEPGDKMWEIQPILTLISDVPSSSPREDEEARRIGGRRLRHPPDLVRGVSSTTRALAAVRDTSKQCRPKIAALEQRLPHSKSGSLWSDLCICTRRV